MFSHFWLNMLLQLYTLIMKCFPLIKIISITAAYPPKLKEEISNLERTKI